MPITAGSLTCRCYRVDDPPPKGFLEDATTELRRHAFRPVRAERSPRSIGWVSVHDVLDTDLSPEKIMVDDFLLLGLRVDKVALNIKLLRAHYMRGLKDLLKKSGGQKLGRDARNLLYEKIKSDLMSKQSPATSLYEMAWNLKTHRVYFTAGGDAINQEFADLFSDTFHTGLMPLFPYIRAEYQAKKDGQLEELMQSTPSNFSPSLATSSMMAGAESEEG